MRWRRQKKDAVPAVAEFVHALKDVLSPIYNPWTGVQGWDARLEAFVSRRLVRLAALRSGQLLNRSELGRDAGLNPDYSRRRHV